MGISLAPDSTQPQDQTAQQPVYKPKAAKLPGTPQDTASLSLAPASSATLQPLANTNTSLLNTTIQPPSADRLQLATDAFKTFATASEPYYTKAINDATSAAASKGQLGSGQLRTSYGDLANQRQLQLDTARDTLINQATSAAADDAYKNVAIQQQQQGFQASQQQAAYGQTLAQAQQALAEQLGTGNLAVSQGQLALQEKLGLSNLSLDQQRVAIAQKQADAEAAYQAGTLTLAQRNQALAELSQAQDYQIQQSKLQLDRQAQDQANALNQAKLALDTKVQTGQLSLAEEQQQLAELTQQQNHALDTAKLQLAKDQLAQTGQQFNLTLAQQKELATLADQTQNRQIDLNSQQGIQQLLVQLVNITKSPEGTVNSSFLAKVLAALGYSNQNTAGQGTAPVATNPYSGGGGSAAGATTAPSGAY